MIVEKFEPSDEVKNILRTVILAHTKIQDHIPSANYTIDDFNRQVIPTENRDRGTTQLSHVVQHTDMLDNVKELMGADQITNSMMYPKNSIMEWHTNADTVGQRIYIIFSKKPGIFRYIDPETGNIIDDYDNPLWTGRRFIVNKNKPLWHTVWAPEKRFAFGFNIKG